MGNKNIHSGHRERIRERFISDSGEGFADHELLEILLFYSVPRANTNDLAHALIERFGTLDKIFNASVAELCSVDGIGRNTAVLLRLFSEIDRRRGGAGTAGRFDSVGKIAAYLKQLFKGLSNERVYLLLFDNGMKLLATVMIAEGTVNCTSITYRKIAEEALFRHAANAVIAHNHPEGIAVPSNADLNVTRYADNVLATVGVNLIDHIVVAGDSYDTIIHGGKYVHADPYDTIYGARAGTPEDFYRDIEDGEK